LGERGAVILGFAGEVQGVARFHNLPRTDADYDGIDVIGTQGALAVRGGFSKFLFRSRGHTFAEKDRWEPVAIPQSTAYFSLDNRGAGRMFCQQMALEMAAAIEQGRQHISSGRDGLISLESLMAVYVSHRQGRPVRLPLIERRHPLELWRAEEITR
jgi:predicted dehydrogenase